MRRIIHFCGVILSCVHFSAMGFEGLNVSELPAGGDVTIPGDYPVQLPSAIDVTLSGKEHPQSLIFSASQPATVQIFARNEKKVRKIEVAPGVTQIYNLKNTKPIRLRVTTGLVLIHSLHPLKIQR